MSQDYNGDRLMSAAPDGSAELDEVPNSPGTMSGSFHYSSEAKSNTKGPEKLWDQHKMDVAGSFEPIGEVSFFSLSGKSAMVRVSVHSGDKLANCETTGNLGEDPHDCNVIGTSNITVHSKGDCNGTCADYDLTYELHPASDQPRDSDADSDYVDRRWYGLTASGNPTVGYDVEFTGTKVLNSNGAADDPHHDAQQKTLRVSIKVTQGVKTASIFRSDITPWLASDSRLDNTLAGIPDRRWALDRPPYKF
jgi:hypothetical protein